MSLVRLAGASRASALRDASVCPSTALTIVAAAAWIDAGTSDAARSARSSLLPRAVGDSGGPISNDGGLHPALQRITTIVASQRVATNRGTLRPTRLTRPPL